MSELMDVCQECAQAAGRVLTELQGRVSVRQKGPGDLVTEADLAAQRTIREIVVRHFPGHDFVGEEGPAELPHPGPLPGPHPVPLPEGEGKRDAEFVWYVDPLDGTTNYVHGLKHFAVSIGVARRGKLSSELVCGVVFDPITKECFAAEKGGGATLNGQPLHTSRTTQLSEALVAVSLPVHAKRGQRAVEQVLDVIAVCQGVRRMGSAALNLCYVAAGRVDAYWDIKTNIWDVAAGVLIVREAGGMVTSLDGGAFDLARPAPVATANETLHRELIGILRNSG